MFSALPVRDSPLGENAGAMLFPTVIPAFAAKTPEALLLILNEARSFDCVIARFALDHYAQDDSGGRAQRVPDHNRQRVAASQRRRLWNPTLVAKSASRMGHPRSGTPCQELGYRTIEFLRHFLVREMTDAVEHQHAAVVELLL